jgi:hypothetical protein
MQLPAGNQPTEATGPSGDDHPDLASISVDLDAGARRGGAQGELVRLGGCVPTCC